jgi:hypothetical protein
LGWRRETGVGARARIAQPGIAVEGIMAAASVGGDVAG